jgi:RNA polymerase sigma factor (sigma-70 family)
MQRQSKARLTSADKELINDLYTEYLQQVSRYVYSHVNDISAVDDIISDTFMLACERASELQNHPNKAGWLFSVARNKILEYRRTGNRIELYGEYSDSFSAGTVDSVSINEMQIYIEKNLTHDEYIRFMRYFIWGYSISEMASMENISKDNMSVRINRLRKKLKELL